MLLMFFVIFFNSDDKALGPYWNGNEVKFQNYFNCCIYWQTCLEIKKFSAFTTKALQENHLMIKLTIKY